MQTGRGWRSLCITIVVIPCTSAVGAHTCKQDEDDCHSVHLCCWCTHMQTGRGWRSFLLHLTSHRGSCKVGNVSQGIVNHDHFVIVSGCGGHDSKMRCEQIAVKQSIIVKVSLLQFLRSSNYLTQSPFFAVCAVFLYILFYPYNFSFYFIDVS